MNAVVQMKDQGLASGEIGRFSAIDIRQRVNLVQEVMQSIMIKDTHYGTIPGTQKPTLYKPGAEVLCVTFRVAQEYKIEDLSTDTVARYRVTCNGIHQPTSMFLGSGVGECSSAEEKYKWRAAVNAQEFDATPENLRRDKFFKNGSKATQVRTESADLANTVLKMACKRAMVAMTLNTTAASDIFTQDIEDLPEDLRGMNEGSQPPPQKGPQPYPQENLDRNKADWVKLIADGKKTAEDIINAILSKATLTDEQKKTILALGKKPESGKVDPSVITRIRDLAADLAVTDKEICEQIGAQSLAEMTIEQAEQALSFLKGE